MTTMQLDLLESDYEGWNTSEIERKQAVERGEAVVACITKDRRLTRWAAKHGLSVYVGRNTTHGATIFGNPFKIGEHGTRDDVCDKFAASLPNRPDILAAIPSLRGKVLVCHCYPYRCHAMTLADLANQPVDTRPRIR